MYTNAKHPRLGFHGQTQAHMLHEYQGSRLGVLSIGEYHYVKSINQGTKDQEIRVHPLISNDENYHNPWGLIIKQTLAFGRHT